MLYVILAFTTINTLCNIWLLHKSNKSLPPELDNKRTKMYISDPETVQRMLRALNNDDFTAVKKEKNSISN